MKLLIDADGCPVVDIAVDEAKKVKIDAIILCDTSHIFTSNYAQVITVEKGADSVDFRLVNLVDAGDIVVTQDYGLAAMCLGKRAIPLSQDGMIYSAENIEALLMQRHISKKIRASGGRTKGLSKRKKYQDESFLLALQKLL